MQIDVRFEIEQAIAKIDRVKKEVADKAIVRALNRVAEQSRTESGQQIRAAGYDLKAGDIKAAISLRRASAGNVRAVVKASGRPIPLIKYAARQTRKGVTVSVKNGRRLIPGAFIATMQSGHTGVFIRAGSGHKKVRQRTGMNWSGLPIKELFGPSIPSAFINKTVQEALVASVRQRFPERLKHELAFLNLKK